MTPEEAADHDQLVEEVRQLRSWKAQALPVIEGLWDLGRELGIPLGVVITGPVGVEAARVLRLRHEAVLAEADRARVVYGETLDAARAGSLGDPLRRAHRTLGDLVHVAFTGVPL